MSGHGGPPETTAIEERSGAEHGSMGNGDRREPSLIEGVEQIGLRIENISRSGG